MRLPAFAIAVLLVMLQWDCRSFAGLGRRGVSSFWAPGADGSGRFRCGDFPIIGEQLNPNSARPELPLQQKDQQEQ
jgi:hypothetical protein